MKGPEIDKQIMVAVGKSLCVIRFLCYNGNMVEDAVSNEEAFDYLGEKYIRKREFIARELIV